MRRRAMLFAILVAVVGASVGVGEPNSQENQFISTDQLMTKKRVLQIGLDPAVVDFSRTPGVDAEQIRAAANASNEKLGTLGYEVHTCLIDLGATAEASVLKELSENTFDCIMIGAGLRVRPEHTVLFEKVINLIHQNAPAAKLCFNTHPSNTPDAVQRCAPVAARDAQEEAFKRAPGPAAKPSSSSARLPHFVCLCRKQQMETRPGISSDGARFAHKP